MSIDNSKRRIIEVLKLIDEWKKYRGRDVDKHFWGGFIDRHRGIFNYTKPSRLYSSTANTELVKLAIDTILNHLFDEDGCDEICEIDFSTPQGVAKFLQMATRWRVKEYPKWVLSSYKHFNWSIGLFLILLSQFTRKRGTAIKVMKDLVKGYKKHNKGG